MEVRNECLPLRKIVAIAQYLHLARILLEIPLLLADLASPLGPSLFLEPLQHILQEKWGCSQRRWQI
jgi:hypothetical protein